MLRVEKKGRKLEVFPIAVESVENELSDMFESVPIDVLRLLTATCVVLKLEPIVVERVESPAWTIVLKVLALP